MSEAIREHATGLAQAILDERLALERAQAEVDLRRANLVELESALGQLQRAASNARRPRVVGAAPRLLPR